MTSNRETTIGTASGQTAHMIDRLASDLRPVRRVRVAHVFGIFLAVEMVAAALGTWALGLRPDIDQRLSEPVFLAVVAFLAIAAASCASAAVRAAIPGHYISRQTEIWLLASPIVLSILILVTQSSEGHWHGWATFLTGCWKCTVVTAASAATPWLVAVFVLRRLAPLIALRVAMFAGFSAFFIGSLVTQLHCPVSSGVHLAFAHFLPVALLSAVACGGTAALLRVRA